MSDGKAITFTLSGGDIAIDLDADEVEMVREAIKVYDEAQRYVPEVGHWFMWRYLDSALVNTWHGPRFRIDHTDKAFEPGKPWTESGFILVDRSGKLKYMGNVGDKEYRRVNPDGSPWRDES